MPSLSRHLSPKAPRNSGASHCGVSSETTTPASFRHVLPDNDQGGVRDAWLAVRRRPLGEDGVRAWGDAFAAALASQRKAQLVTGDPELKALAGTISLRWLA